MNDLTRISDVRPGFNRPDSPSLKSNPRPTYERLRRLSHMPWSEIAGRGRQAAFKWIDRITTVDRAIDAETLLAEHGPALANPVDALEMLREKAPRRFFAGVENPSAISNRLPDHHNDIVFAASAVIENRFDLLGYRTLSFGDPIDWHLDPVWSRRAPLVHWSLLDPLDAAAVGDSKIVWELNRHQWLVRLAQAHALTGDERYAEPCLRAVEAWLRENPPGIGINWSSSLEVAYRLMSWSWMLLLLRQSAALSGQRLVSILAGIWLHANHIARYLSYYFSPNTHLTGEALGLFYAGMLFPEFHEAQRWRDRGLRILVAESQAQICRDGVHFERSTCYQRYTAETYQHFLLLADRNRIAVPAEVVDRLQHVVDFLVAVRQPDGWLPEIGDADGGRLSPVVDRPQGDPRGVFAVAAAMFGRADCAWAAQGLTPDVPWLMGVDGTRVFESVRPSKPAGAGSRLFHAGGYAVMRSGWDRDAHQMVVDVGPLGCSVSSGHGHADLLSIQLAAFGEACVVDAGTYCYTSETEWRNFFRGTAAHSTLMVDGRAQVEPDGPFSWRGRPRVNVREWRSNAECDFIDADHDAYTPLIHRRRVLFVKPHYWTVIDDVTASEKVVGCLFPPEPAKKAPDPIFVHHIDVGFQFAPMVITLERDSWARANTSGGNTLWVGSFSSAPLHPAIRTGERAPIRGWISSDYGQRTPAPMLIYSCETSLPWRSITLMMPRRGGTSAPPEVEPLYDDRNLPIGIEIIDRHESIFVDESGVFISKS